MNAQFGEVYADSFARDQVIEGLGSRTVAQALAEGRSVKSVWRAVCVVADVPEHLR